MSIIIIYQSIFCSSFLYVLSFRKQRIFITFQKVFFHLPLDKICHEYLFDQCNLQPVGPEFHVFLDEYRYLARHLEKSLTLAWFNNRSKLFLNSYIDTISQETFKLLVTFVLNHCKLLSRDYFLKFLSITHFWIIIIQWTSYDDLTEK